MIRAVIFDLDGTLLDSEPIYREVDARFLLEKGILLADDEWDRIVGMGGAPFFHYLVERHGLEGDTDAFVAEKDDAYLEYAPGRAEPFPRVLEFARLLHVHGYNLAIATSSRRRVLDRMITATGLAGIFSATVAGDEVRRAKPAPDAFLLAASELRVEPSECLVLEDSVYGVRAAAAAGMRVVALPHPGTESNEDFGRADLTVKGGAAALDLDAVVSEFGLFAPPDETGRSHGDERSLPAPAIAPWQIDRFRDLILGFYRENRRPMPWRETRDPYRILVSEFMLQQTQVARVLPKYEDFLKRFPTVAELAESRLADVLSLWQGLGYNRRGKNLREAAVTVMDEFAGGVPTSVDELIRLPGVGPYTAAAVAAFSADAEVVVLETNIRRVFLHFFAPGRSEVRDRELEPLIRATLTRPVRDWYYALMDYGAYLGRVYPNANRRSRSYARQSAFVGSVREVRGRILRELTRAGVLSEAELETRVGPTDERYLPALKSLEGDGMIVRANGTIRIA